MISKYRLVLLAITLLAVAGIVGGCENINSSPSLTLLSLRPAPTPTSESWLRLPDMPETATQADYGAEIYRLVCRDCHGDRGQGLTDEWRATWAPEDQNCWQSKCHVGNIPPEGFLLPRYVPPLLGEGSLSNHDTALDLYNFIRLRMPWHTPGSLQDWEYMQLTAFLARERGLNPDLPLDENKAGKLLLSP